MSLVKDTMDCLLKIIGNIKGIGKERQKIVC